MEDRRSTGQNFVAIGGTISTFDTNADTTMLVEELHHAESLFLRADLLRDEYQSESSNIIRSTDVAQDVTMDEFGDELERLLVEDQQLETMNMSELIAPNNNEDGALHGDMKNSEVLHGNKDWVENNSHGAPTNQQLNLVGRPVLPFSESVGVTYHRKNKQWEAHFWLKGQQLRNKRKKKGVQLFLGSFTTADEAKQVHDRAAIKLDVRETGRGKAYPLNFPESVHASYIAEHQDWSARDFLWKLRRLSSKFNKGKSRMKGVTVRKAGRKSFGTSELFEAKISQTLGDGEKTTFDLGKFESEEEAGEAYDRALLFLKGADELTCITNFRPSRYSAAEIQEAGSKLTVDS